MTVTPCVTNHPRNLDHLVVNPNNPKEIKFSNKEVEIQYYVVIDPDASIQDFLLVYKVDFDFDPKHQFILVSYSINM
jgi:hypothetical protein